MTALPEVWLRGPVRGYDTPDGYDPHVLPIVHALLQAREDIERLAAGIGDGDAFATPGEAASVAFHVRHLAGSLDRLFTYARGEGLSDTHLRALRSEKTVNADRPAFETIVAETHAAIDAALAQLRTVTADRLLEPRTVGRAGLPSTVLGLFFHAAEHAARHVGQAITTAKVVRAGTRPSP